MTTPQAREIELEKRLEVETSLRLSMQTEKDAKIFEMQKQYADALAKLRQSEGRSSALQGSVDSIQAAELLHALVCGATVTS